MMTFTNRDLRLLKALNRYGILSTSQIQGICFSSAHRRTVLRRLRLLRKNKFITQHHGLSRGQLVWTLGAKGAAQLSEDGCLTLNKNTLEHDVRISDIRIALDRAGLGQGWQSAYVMRAQASQNVSPDQRIRDQIPDALFAVQTSNGLKMVALEVELVSKSIRRYRKIISEYNSKRAIDYVWYVITVPRLGKRLIEVANASVTGEKKIIWSNLEDVLRDPKAVVIHTQTGAVCAEQVWKFRQAK